MNISQVGQKKNTILESESELVPNTSVLLYIDSLDSLDHEMK